jgi:hypothetical protein
MKHLILLISVLFLYPYKTYSQNNGGPTIHLPSSNAISMGVFNEFPSVLSNGSPSIEIPVYTVNYRNFSLPINLMYNTNLVKPDIHPGWVGLGWNLSSGGSIVRVVNDKPDDLYTYDMYAYSTTNENKVGYYFNYAHFTGNWDSDSKIRSATTDSKSYEHSPVTSSTIKDYRPDEFNFSFANISGSFYLDETRNWKVRCDKKIKVEFLDKDFMGSGFNGAQGFGKFTLTDDKGVKYIFGGYKAAVEYSAGLFTMDYPVYAPTAWYLTKVILNNGETINFKYERETAVISPQIAFGLGTSARLYLTGSIILPSYIRSISTPKETIEFKRSKSDELTYNPTSFRVTENYMDRRYESWLNQSFAYPPVPNFDPFFNWSYYVMPGRIEKDSLLIHNGTWYKLDEIYVANRSLGKQRTYKLKYDNQPLKRLKLNEIVEEGSESTIGKVYSIKYNDNVPLPPYLYYRTDLWDYYNGKVPDYSTKNAFLNSKKPDAYYLQAELINEIVFPTGGRIKYTFEPHYYSKELDSIRYNPLITNPSNTMAGGVRIERVDFFNAKNELIDWKKYKYELNYQPSGTSGISSGILGGVTLYYFASYGGGDNDARKIGNIPASHNNTGSHVAYSEVAEISSNGGYTVNKYSNFDNGQNNEYMDEPPTYLMGRPVTEGFISKAFERGKLLSKNIYDNNDHPLKSLELKYSRINQSGNYVRGYNTHNDVLFNPLRSTLLSTAVKTYTYNYLVSQETTTDYFPSMTSSSKIITDYTYDPLNLNLIGITTSNSKQEIEQVVNLYPKDIVNLSSYYEPVYEQMVSANIISPIVKTLKSVNGVATEMLKTEYKRLGTSLFVPSKDFVQYGAGTEKVLDTYTEYDQLGNLLSVNKEDGVTSSFIYGYNDMHPIAKIKNGYNSRATPPPNPLVLNMPYGITQMIVTTIDVQTAVGVTELKFLYTGVPNGSSSAVINCILTGPNNFREEFKLDQSSNGFSTNTSRTFYNLPIGSYTLNAQYSNRTNLNVDMKVEVNTSMSSLSSVYCENFEDNGSIGNAHTGLKFNAGAFNPQFNAYLTNTYVVDYFYRINGVWKYAIDNYTGPKSLLPLGADAIDDVRIYPANAQMTSYTYDFSAGMTSQIDTRGNTTYYSYDSFQRLSQIKDSRGNIIKQFCYNYAGQQTDCTIRLPRWVNTATAVRCKVDVGNHNTGEQEQEQQDLSVTSPTYNQKRWVVSAVNTTSCPLPVINTCVSCYNEGQMCINGNCETGIKVYTSSQLMSNGLYNCTYHYEFSDGSWSETYTQQSTNECNTSV